MFNLIKLIRNTYSLNSRLAHEKATQREGGYEIEIDAGGGETWVVYREGEREIYVGYAWTSWVNDVVVYTDSLRRWSKPYGETLTDFDFQRAKNRVVKFLACWGGEVGLDDTLLPTSDEFRKDLEEAGIPYEEKDGVIHYTIDIEKERSRKGGFFDRSR